MDKKGTKSIVLALKLCLAIAASLIFTACVPAQIAPTPGTATPAPEKPQAPGQKSEWDNLVAAAQKEGTVLIYASFRPKLKDAITTAFKSKYGINLDQLTGKAPELMARINAERRAGLYLPDFSALGPAPFILDMKPMGITPSLEPMLILPEVKDPKNWRGGKLPFLDKEKMAISIVLVAQPKYFRNTHLVTEGDISTPLDLLHPRWREKIVMSDPSTPGGASDWFAWTVVGNFGREKGLQFMKDLAAQKPMVTRDERLAVDWVARGKYPIGIGPSISLVAEFVQMGAPIAFMPLEKVRSISSGGAVINGFKEAPHPNAAKLFLNWVLSKEGSSVFAPASEYPSTRSDVPPDGVLPILVPQPDDVNPQEKYDNWSDIINEMQKEAAGIFGVLR